MFLKSLELNGFKSFAGKTILEFPAGITAIVGPNGSGKSNIIDCLRWLLGERDTKMLRGEKAEDLIWGGSPKRPRVGLAQASILFDNGSGFFAVEFPEVVVGRRVSRDGESEYFLNKKPVRLKDIVDFMSKARLGTKGLTIIGQGSSDLFVRAAPEERRIMIEEILGLREYQLKKSEAERKLKATFFNLEKVKAMITEVAPRLRLLRRQTGKWARRAEIESNLRQLENDFFSFKLGELGREENKWKSKLAVLDKEVAAAVKELRSAEEEIKKTKSESGEYELIKKIKSDLRNLTLRRSEMEKELGRIEGKIEFLSSRKEENIFGRSELLRILQEVKNELGSVLRKDDWAEIKNTLEALFAKVSGFLSGGDRNILPNAEIKELENARKSLLEKFNKLNNEIGNLEKEENHLALKIQKENVSFEARFSEFDSRRAALRRLEDEKNKIILEQEKLNLKYEDIKHRLAEAGRDMKEFKGVKAPELVDSDALVIEKKMLRLRSELASLGEIDEGLLKEAEEVEAHHKFLTSQCDDLEKASVDLKQLVAELEKKIYTEFHASLKLINEEFNKFFRLMFGGGSAKLKVKSQISKIKMRNQNENSETEITKRDSDKTGNDGDEPEEKIGIEIDLSLPKKRTTGLEMLSGGEKSLVSIAALFSLIAVSPPPFLVLDEIDAALDEKNSKRFAHLIKEFSKKTQFLIATHNRATMEVADALYGVTMGDDGASRVLSLKLE